MTNTNYIILVITLFPSKKCCLLIFYVFSTGVLTMSIEVSIFKCGMLSISIVKIMEEPQGSFIYLSIFKFDFFVS